MYLTYSEYQAMGGTLDETTFSEYDMQAEALMDYLTFSRLRNEETYSERVKQCVFQLIKMAKLKSDASVLGESEDGSSGAIASQSNDGVSVSYNVLSASEIFKDIEGQMIQQVKIYLEGERNSKGKRLLYRGLYPDE